MNEQQVFWIWKPLLRKGEDKKLISTKAKKINQHKYLFHMSHQFCSLIHDISYSDFTETFSKRKHDELITHSCSEEKKCLWVICPQSNQPKATQTPQWHNPNTPMETQEKII